MRPQTVAPDETVAERLYELLRGDPAVTAEKVSGALTVLTDGNLTGRRAGGPTRPAGA
jgi:hypothetical protein